MCLAPCLGYPRWGFGLVARVSGGKGGLRPVSRRLGKRDAQDAVVDLVRQGSTVKSALARVGRHRKTYEEWRREDADFVARIDQAKAQAAPRETKERPDMGFAEFRRDYLHTETFWHQLQWVDILEGREPRDLHESQVYEPARRDRLMILTPPFHAKSKTLTVDYSVYRLCMDPAFRILIVSAGAQLAEDFLFEIKIKLTDPAFIDMQRDFGPEGGWQDTAEQWTNSRIVFGTEFRSQGIRQEFDKDPNVEAIGMRSKIYGKRADLIILDDAIDRTNVLEYEKQIGWLTNEVQSRLQLGVGKLLCVGTRVGPIDLYSELLNPKRYGRGKVPWTLMKSPAILVEGDSPADAETLWPEADIPWVDPRLGVECVCEDPTCIEGHLDADGNRRFPRWDGTHLELGPRSEMSESDFALIYQQTAVSENATFPEHAIGLSTNNRRVPGLLKADTVGHPPGGMHNKYVIAGCDPAVKGNAAIVVLALDRDTEKRYLLDAYNIKGPTPARLKGLIKSTTADFQVDEWRVEKTGLLQFFTQDQELRKWLQTRGVSFKEHNTNKSTKWDPSYGVASMSGLFGAWDRVTDSHGKAVSDWREIEPPLVELPRLTTDALRAFRHQLVIWTPEANPARVPCDLVMAFWFAEIGCRELLGRSRSGEVTAFSGLGKLMPRKARRRRATIFDAGFSARRALQDIEG